MSAILDISKCKGIVQQGPRKGLQCLREKRENDYCIYHQRNYEYDQLIALGKNLCNGFFRGCNNELSSEDIKKHYRFCSLCRLKKSGKLHPCQFKGCNFKTENEDDKYCMKHIRELLRDHEKEKDIRYCDISRGCFNLLTTDIKCTECREKERIKVTNEMTLLRKQHNIILASRDEPDELFEKQESISTEIKEVWRNCQKNAIIRKMLFTLTQENFEKIVIQPCYYCGFYSNYKFVGIDRIDNNKGYIPENCIPACKMCNMMKHTCHPIEFLDKVSMIVTYKQTHKPIYKTDLLWESYLSSGRKILYNEYKKDSEDRNIKFFLTQTEYDTLIKGECYLCGITPMEGHRNGIDRVDNNDDYTFENCKTCCGHCNRMKRNYLYEDIIRKCTQIKLHNCDRTKFSGIPVIDPKLQKLTNEYYSAEDIAKFLRDGHLTRFLEWCDEKDKSFEFKTDIIYLASKLEDDLQEKLRKALDNERSRKASQEKKPEKEHLHCSTVYAWLINGKEDEFLQWYTSTYEKTKLFDTRFQELKSNLYSMTKDEGIKACKKFMYDEKSRRNSQKIRDEKSRKKTQYITQINNNDSISLPTIKVETKNELVKSQVKTAIQEKIDCSPKKDKQTKILKQWKTRDIYNHIIKGNENTYLTFVKENNDITDIPDFDLKWNTLVKDVKNKSITEAEDDIQLFVTCLRTIRHNKLCAITNKERILEKEDRQHYRADSILALFQTNNINELQKFKTFTETYAGDNPDDPKWIKRWNEFIIAVNNESTDENKKKLVSKFLMAQRKKKNDRTHRT